MSPPKAPPLIFINTDNSNPHDKVFQAAKAGSAKAEELMQKTIVRIIDKADGFTTKSFDNAKGFTIRLTVSSVEVEAHRVKCAISGSIEYYPPQSTKNRGKGAEMLSTGMSGHAAADGTSERSILDCVEAITEDLTNKAIPIMRSAFAKRYGAGN